MLSASTAETTASIGTSHRSEIFRLRSVRDQPVRAAHDHVGLDAAAAQLGDRVLGGLGLLLPRRAEVGHQGEVDVADVVTADVPAELADGLDERDDLDVADGAADLDDDHVDVVGAEPADPLLISSVTCGMTWTVRPR